MIKTYSYKKDKNIQLAKHFKVGEFRCKDGTDKILINQQLPLVLENLYTYLDNKYGIRAININSGYRTPSHSVKVGGYATDQHTKGNASDIHVLLKNGKRLDAKKICLALEDLKHNGGVGYINTTSVHVDLRGKKVYFDETNNEKTTTSWYKYWGITKEQPKPTPVEPTPVDPIVIVLEPIEPVRVEPDIPSEPIVPVEPETPVEDDNTLVEPIEETPIVKPNQFTDIMRNVIKFMLNKFIDFVKSIFVKN